MIPKFHQIFLPLMEYLQDGKERTLAECTEHISNVFKLTEEERNTLIPSGGQYIIRNRTGWAKFYLNKAGLVDVVKKGKYIISNDGRALMATKPSEITFDILAKYRSYTDFQKECKAKNTNEEDNEAICNASSDKTFDEIIGETYLQWKSQMADELLDCVMKQNPRFFEKLVKDLLEKMGYGEGVTTQYTQDGGIDAIINEDALGLDVIVVQAKRWARDHKVSSPDLQAFVGAMSGKAITKGVFITTSSFTTAALNYKPNVKMALIDGKQLAYYMIKYGLGVSTTDTYELKRIDTDYFDE